MADNFDLRKFLTENKLTKNAQLLNEARVDGFDVNKKAFEVSFINKYGGGDFRILNAETPEQAEEVFTDIFVNNPDFVQSIKSIEPYQAPAPKPQAQSRPGLEGVNHRSIEIDGVDSDDYPDFVDAYVISAEFEDGTPLSEEELEQLTDELYQSGELADMAAESLYEGKERIKEASEEITGIYDQAIRNVLGFDAKEKEGFDLWHDTVMNIYDKMHDDGKIKNATNISRAEQEVKAWMQANPQDKSGDDFVNFPLDIREAKSYKVSKNSKEAQHLKKGDIIGSGELVDMAAETLYENKKKPIMKETKLTAKERRLVEMVNSAMREEEEGNTFFRTDKDDQIPNPPAELHIPKELTSEDEMADETVIPEYNTIDELMNSIDHGTNKVAEEHKMQEMKKIAGMLREKAKRMEESEHAAHISPKDLKQLATDAAKLEKAAEKLKSAFDKKFNKKEKPASAPKAEKVEALQEGTFDLRKFLTENKITTNSRMMNENTSGRQEVYYDDALFEIQAKYPNLETAIQGVKEYLDGGNGVVTFDTWEKADVPYLEFDGPCYFLVGPDEEPGQHPPLLVSVRDRDLITDPKIVAQYKAEDAERM